MPSSLASSSNVQSCGKEEVLPPGLRAGGLKLADEKKQELVLEEMSRQLIPFEIDERV